MLLTPLFSPYTLSQDIFAHNLNHSFVEGSITLRSVRILYCFDKKSDLGCSGGGMYSANYIAICYCFKSPLNDYMRPIFHAHSRYNHKTAFFFPMAYVVGTYASYALQWQQILLAGHVVYAVPIIVQFIITVGAHFQIHGHDCCLYTTSSGCCWCLFGFCTDFHLIWINRSLAERTVREMEPPKR